MSEYWKSTPKYWCKHCKIFVRDTKLEKQNHEATPKHQGNLQRFLRDLHRGHEREERDAQRAKDEVARLNGIAGGSKDIGGLPEARKPAIVAPTDNRQAAPADRKRQLAQLAEMGVAVPEDFRREMAMAGDWQTQSIRPIYEQVRKEKGDTDSKTSGLAIGVRKRKYEGDEEKEEAGEVIVKRGWGSTTRTWNSSDDGDLDALLKTTKTVRKASSSVDGPVTQPSSTNPPPIGEQSSGKLDASPGEATIKLEDPEDKLLPVERHLNQPESADTPLKDEEDAPEPGVVFKKRKARAVCQKG